MKKQRRSKCKASPSWGPSETQLPANRVDWKPGWHQTRNVCACSLNEENLHMLFCFAPVIVKSRDESGVNGGHLFYVFCPQGVQDCYG
jgi:hypothetical protein